jgi:nicotinamidase-related amidase
MRRAVASKLCGMITSSRTAGVFVGLLLLGISTYLLAAEAAATPSSLRFVARSRPQHEGTVVVNERTIEWDAKETAVVICDMWDKHWCEGATRRGGVIAPHINELAKAVRARGGFIVHAPSDTMKFYEGTPGRELAKNAPKVTPPTPSKGWRYLDLECEAPLPIDDKDGGCDCEPQCKNYRAWTREHPAVEVAPGDAVSQDGQEIYNLFHQRGIKHVIYCGVHANMCVLGRTFGVRQMTEWGFDCVLARDLTDTMYNPRMAPKVSHEKGTELMIEHYERYWCPTTTSEQIIGGK